MKVFILLVFSTILAPSFAQEEQKEIMLIETDDWYMDMVGETFWREQ